MPNSAPPNEPLHRYLDDLARAQFFGTITVKIERGLVTYVREERGWKLQELPSSETRQANDYRTK